jgi:hypothetical protein
MAAGMQPGESSSKRATHYAIVALACCIQYMGRHCAQRSPARTPYCWQQMLLLAISSIFSPGRAGQFTTDGWRGIQNLVMQNPA